MSKLHDLRLIDPSKNGTLIVATHRCGSHFLQDVVEQRARNHINGMVHAHSRILNVAQDHDRRPIDEIEKIPGYHIGIINTWHGHLELLSDRNLLNRYHVIRIIHNDLIRWFLSFYFYILHPKGHDQEFKHHGTTKETYTEALENYSPIELDNKELLNISILLMENFNTYSVPVDEEIVYDDLPSLADDLVVWQPNRYPDLTLEDLFRNAHKVRAIIDSWNVDRPRKFKTL